MGLPKCRRHLAAHGARAIRHGPPHQVRLHDGGRHRRLQPSPARLPYGHLSRRRLVHPQSRTRQKRVHRRPVRSLFQLHFHWCPQSPVQGIRRRSHQKAHGAGLPQTHPHPQGRPCFESKALRYAKTNVRSNSRTPHTGRYPPQGVSPARKTGTRAIQKSGGPAVAARKQTTQATAKAATKTIPPKKEAPGKQAAQAPNTKKGAVSAKNTPVSEPAKAKAAPAKAGKAAQPATKPQTAAQNGQPAKPTSNTQKPAPNKAAQPVAGKKAVPAKADGKTTATAKAPVKTKAEQPKAATQTAKTTATAPAKAAQAQKPAQNSKASAKAPTNSAPVKARATQAKPEKAAPKQPAKTAQQKSGK